MLQAPLDLLVAAGEEGDHAIDRAPVLLLIDVADAGRLTALDVVIETRRPAPAPGLGAFAGAEHEHLAQHLERGADTLGVRIGPEIGSVAAVALAREIDAGEIL